MNGNAILPALVLLILFAGSAEAQVNINSCQWLSTPGTTYRLTQSITNTVGTCMWINANSIVLDCQGFTIDGDDLTLGDAGVGIWQSNNVVVMNCVLTDFDFGVYSNGNFSIILNNTATSNRYGVVIDSNNNDLVSNNTAYANTVAGVWIFQATNSQIFNNLFNNTNNVFFSGTVLANSWNTAQQNGVRIYSPGTQIGGNYWTNPTGTGYSDTCIDSNRDGFCDAIYSVPGGGINNRDFLPLSNQWLDTTPPVLTVISPQSTTYYSAYFWATISTNENCSAAYYSLNGGPNQALTKLSPTSFSSYISTSKTGSNSIVFYANDPSGNWGASSAVSFTVSVSSIPFCPFSINTPGNYVLSGNLGSAGTCININSNNVVFDCRGYSITGTDAPGSIGVSNVGYDTVTVRNCVINDFEFGVQFRNGAEYGTIEGNTLNSCTQVGVYLNGASNNMIRNNLAQYNGYDGFQLYSNSNYNLLLNNTARYNRDGIYIGFSGVNNITGNTIGQSGWESVDLYSASNNVFYNNLFNDSVYLYTNDNSPNYWSVARQAGTRVYSEGTEIGGNYWTNPTGTGHSDTCNDINRDGFCDDAYAVAANNIDYLPMSDEYSSDTTPPVITLLSPQNTTYSTSTVALTFTVSEPTSWIGYSLDGAANMTITGNTTLSGLTEGPHDILVYARDTSNNLGASSRVYFSVSVPANSITSCPYSINSPGTYVLTQDLTSSGTCITINSANVVLDCMGYSITGIGTTGIVFGIYNPASNYVTVKNCVVRGYNAQAFEYGIEFGTQNCLNANGPGFGIIYNNTLESNWQGIYLCGGQFNNISGNNVTDSSNIGIYINNMADHNTISDNVVTSTTGAGIAAGNANCISDNNITDNFVGSNQVGISLYIGCGNRVTGNTITSNTDAGMVLNFGGGNLIYNNYFSNTANAYDSGGNVWNITKTLGTNIVGGPYIGGNYWSDYAGVDTDGDGIGNTLLPYDSNGGITSGGDYLPLLMVCIDNDGDGYSPYVNPNCPNDPILDCNDDNPFIRPNCNDICNNIDDNCDGQVDQAFYWCGYSGIGECKLGLQSCTAGVLGSCIGAVYPSPEVWDGKDNDCDGQIDEGLSPPLKPGTRPTVASSD